MRVSVYRRGHFNAAHRMHNPNWSDEKNKTVYGLCNNANYHGHNYELEVKLTGDVDPDTGYVYDMKDLADLIKSEVEDRFDHKNLNLDTVEFKELVPSSEHMVYVIYNILLRLLQQEKMIWNKKRLCIETQSLFFIIFDAILSTTKTLIKLE
jgi:6-pyruvoyltetrahydropterin/6-carboxytetrahydropterin synthase